MKAAASVVILWWREEDSNLRSRPTTDLQSVPFGHSGIPPDEELSNYGAGDGTRTRNLLITSQLLYQLSYASFCITIRTSDFPYTKKTRSSLYRLVSKLSQGIFAKIISHNLDSH
jgi:hypothetical protein